MSFTPTSEQSRWKVIEDLDVGRKEKDQGRNQSQNRHIRCMFGQGLVGEELRVFAL